LGANAPGMNRVAAILAICAVSAGCKADLYRTFERPDGLYSVEVWRQPQIFAMPGQAGDAPGTLRLLNAAGRKLAETSVEMVQLVQRVDWSGGHARIDLIVDWDLAALPPHD
jgi:hypothetical protein